MYIVYVHYVDGVKCSLCPIATVTNVKLVVYVYLFGGIQFTFIAQFP